MSLLKLTNIQLPWIGKVSKPTPWIVGLATTGVIGAAALSYVVIARTTPKTDLSTLTVPAERNDLTVQITASGSVVPIQSVNLSPPTAGRLAELYVEQGDRVTQGQVVARMEDSDIQAQLVQARARVAQAQARLNQARAGTRPEEIGQAQARLNQARARLAQARAGTRSEEIAQAEAQIRAAQARVSLTSTRVNRYRGLAQEGAITQDRFDEVVTDDQSARAALQEAQRRAEQLRNGTRPEEIAQAEAEVAEARQGLALAQQGSRPEEIAQAEAEVAAAQGELQGVEVQQEETYIRAPFAGIVTQKYATEGAFVTPTTSASSTTSATSTSIVAIAKGQEILAKVPEVDISQIKQGQAVEIVADSFADKVFKGRVRLISPEAVVEQNVTSFQVRVAITTGQNQLKSGMNVNLTFLGNAMSDVLVVPTVAIATQKGQTGVCIPNAKSQPEFRPITIGPSIEDKTQVLSGLQAGERVFIDFPPQRKQQKKDTNEPC